MKMFKYSECVLDEWYFFVFNGIVYYGQAVKADWDAGDEPTHFTVETLYEGGKDICDVWDATLIFQM